MRERDEMRNALERVAARNRALMGQNEILKGEILVTSYEVDRLLDDKIKLARELREARATIDFLEGRHRGWPRA